MILLSVSLPNPFLCFRGSDPSSNIFHSESNVDTKICRHEYDLSKGDPDKDDDPVTHRADYWLCWREIAWGVAAVTDKLHPEISYPALAVFGVATAIGVSFKVVSRMVWMGEQKKKKKPERLALGEEKRIECADEEWVKEQEKLLDGDVDLVEKMSAIY